MFGLFAVLAAPGRPGTVTLSGETITEADTPVTALFSGMRVNSDGTIDKKTGDSGAGGPTYTQIDAATDYVIPNSASGGLKFKLSQNSGDTLDVSSDALDAYLPASGNPEWYFQEEVLSRTGNFTLSASYDGVSAVATNTYIFTLTVI